MGWLEGEGEWGMHDVRRAMRSEWRVVRRGIPVRRILRGEVRTWGCSVLGREGKVTVEAVVFDPEFEFKLELELRHCA